MYQSCIVMQCLHVCFSVQNDSKHIIFKKSLGERVLSIWRQQSSMEILMSEVIHYHCLLKLLLGTLRKKAQCEAKEKKLVNFQSQYTRKLLNKSKLWCFQIYTTSRLMLENSLTIQDFKKLPDIFQFVNCLVPIQENVFSRTFVMYLQCLAMTSSLPAQSIAT